MSLHKSMTKFKFLNFWYIKAKNNIDIEFLFLINFIIMKLLTFIEYKILISS